MPSAIHSIKTKKCYRRWHKAKERSGALLPRRLPTLVPCLDLDYLLRPKGQSTAGLAAGIHFDIATMKHTVLNGSTVTSEKHIPRHQKPLRCRQCRIWSCHQLYIRQLAWWSKQHNWPELYLTSSHIFANTSPRMTQAIGTMSTFSYLRHT